MPENPNHRGGEQITVTRTCDLSEIPLKELLGITKTVRDQAEKLIGEYEKRVGALLRSRGVDLEFQIPGFDGVPINHLTDQGVQQVTIQFPVRKGRSVQALKKINEKIPEGDFGINDQGVVGTFHFSLLEPGQAE